MHATAVTGLSAFGRLASWLSVTAVLTACAAPQGPPRAPLQGAELQRYCASQMYAARLAKGREAVNWAIYDRCIEQHVAAR